MSRVEDQSSSDQTRNADSRDLSRETENVSKEQGRDRPGNLIEEWIRNARDRREERRQQRQERRNEGRPRSDETSTEKVQVNLKDEGGVKELKLPRGFTKAPDVEPSQLNFNEKRIVFENKNSAGTKICYSKDEGWMASQNALDALKKQLGKPPHRLSDAETDEIAEIIPKPPFGTRGPFTVTGLSTKEVNGQTVLVMEISNDNSDRRVYGYFFNPQYAKRDDKTGKTTAGTLETLWFEATSAEYKAQQKAALDAIHSAKFK